MSDCCKENTCKPGTIQEPTDCFDDCRLAISQDDFKKIDTNGSGTLTAGELANASQSIDFKGDKSQHLKCLSSTVANSSVEADVNGKPVKFDASLPSWHTTDFARQQLSADDFKLIDADGDNLLSAKELKEATGKDSKLDKMDKHAASILSSHLDAALNDPLMALAGGVKNWHERSILAKPDKEVKSNEGMPGVRLTFDENLAAHTLDEKGRPAVLESSGGLYHIKYDDKGRVSEIKTEFGDNLGNQLRSVTYDENNRTQTITETGPSGRVNARTVNHLDADGRIRREDHKWMYDPEETTTLFNENGKITSQTRQNYAGRTESNIRYNDRGERLSATSSHFNEKGLKTQDESYDFQRKISTSTKFDAQGRVKSVTEINDPSGPKKTIHETMYDDNGDKTGTKDILMSEKPFLAASITQRDANGSISSEARAKWQINGGVGRVESIEYSDANGEKRVLSKSSQGEDAKLFQSLQRQFYESSHPNWQGPPVDDLSPGASSSTLHQYAVA